MLGYALGEMGMSLGDFCLLRPEEFREACRAYADKQERMMRQSWEQTRMHATITLQPYARKKLTPKQLLPLPWDRPGYSGDSQMNKAKPSTRERFEQLVRKLEG